jgi:hypothetical protein
LQIFKYFLIRTDNREDAEDMTVHSLYDSHQVSVLAENVVDKQRTIEISDCGISSTQFDLLLESKEYCQQGSYRKIFWV